MAPEFLLGRNAFLIVTKKGYITMSAKKPTKTEEVKVPVAETAETKLAAKAVKPAAKKPAAKKPEAEKPAAKKAAAKKPAVKKAVPDINEIVAKLQKKIGKKNVSNINEKIAVEVKVYGEYESYLYILIDDGKVDVKPYGYTDHDVHIDLPIQDAVAILDGDYDYKAKILSGDFYAVGSLTKLFKVKETLF